MQRLPLRAIRNALFDNPVGASEIRKRYRIGGELTGANLEKAIFKVLGQELSTPQSDRSNGEIFRAAAMALASNSRSWSRVVIELTHIFDRPTLTWSGTGT